MCPWLTPSVPDSQLIHPSTLDNSDLTVQERIKSPQETSQPRHPIKFKHCRNGKRIDAPSFEMPDTAAEIERKGVAGFILEIQYQHIAAAKAIAICAAMFHGGPLSSEFSPAAKLPSCEHTHTARDRLERNFNAELLILNKFVFLCLEHGVRFKNESTTTWARLREVRRLTPGRCKPV